MIATVFASTTEAKDPWSVDLLEASWRQVDQPGILFQLTAARPGAGLPAPRHARPVATMSFSPHPYTGDDSLAYLLPAGLIEWLLRERFDGTVLVLETSSVLREPIEEEVTPGKVVAASWADLPRPGNGPFGLGEELGYLERVCADHGLEVPGVGLPALVHSQDLIRLAPRWLELTMLLREECREWPGWSDSTHRLAFALALAEWELEVDSRPFAVDAAGGGPSNVRPRRCDGVREARVLDQMLLDVPGQEGTISLSPSAAAIWELIDDSQSVAGIARDLEQKFDKASGELDDDVETAIEMLREAGALEIVPVAR